MTLEEILMKQGSTGAANFFATGNDMARVQKEVQQQRELGQIKSGVAGSTGPDDAIKRLMAIGTPAAIEIASKLKGLREPSQVVVPGGALVQGGKEIYKNPPNPLKPEPPRTRNRFDGTTVIQEEQTPEGWREIGRGPRFNPVTGDAPSITGDTLEMDAWRYLTDGTLPPNMGRGTQGAKQAANIRNRSSELAKEMGMDPSEIRFGNLTNKAAVSAISQLGRARAQILQFEKTAMANADIALAQSNKVDRTGVPLINKYLLAPVKTQLMNDPEFLKLHNATETFISEYARVMGGGYGAAQTTEGAQQRAHTLLNSAHTKEQFEALIGKNGLLRQEMRNREKALNDQMDEEKRGLRGGLPQRPGATAVPSASPIWDDAKEQRYQELLRKRGGS